jgi:hypothetical protein
MALPLLAGCGPRPSAPGKPNPPPGVVWPDTPDQPPAEPAGWQTHPLDFAVVHHAGTSSGTARVLVGGPPKRLRERADGLALRWLRPSGTYDNTWVWEDGGRLYLFSVGRPEVFAEVPRHADLHVVAAQRSVTRSNLVLEDDAAEVGEYRPVRHRGRPGVDVIVSAGPYHIVSRMVVDEAAELAYQAQVSVARTAGRLRVDDPKVRAFLDGFEPPPPGDK